MLMNNKSYSFLYCIKEDVKRYKENGKFEWFEPSLLVIINYRVGRFLRSIRPAIIGKLLSVIHLPFYMFFTVFTGIYLPRGTQIGPGLRIWHFGCIMLNPDTIIGSNCTLRQGVTIGNRKSQHDVPVIGDNVDIGAGAKILGDIVIGNNVSIGANAVVLKDIPDNSVAVGVPAKIIERQI